MGYWDNVGDEVDSYVIAYHDSENWRTIIVPCKNYISVSTIERLIADLNKVSPIVYNRVNEGIRESENHYTKKGEFFGL